MDDIKNIFLSESGNTDPEHTDMKERAELSDTPLRDEITEDNDNESPRNENPEERDTEDLRMQLCTSNYVIMREIMSHLNWREQVPCELVCRLWRDAVKSVRRTSSLRSYDFAFAGKYYGRELGTKLEFHVSDLPVQTRPMIVIGFYDNFNPQLMIPCKNISPAPCDPSCDIKHNAMEAVHAMMLPKRSRLLSVYGNGLVYIPRPASRTSIVLKDTPLLCLGLHLPKMPNVNYRTVHYHTEGTVEDFHSVVDDICNTDIIKGIIIFFQPHPLQFHDMNFDFLNYFKTKQPSIPYALGGCVAWDMMRILDTYSWDVRVTMGVFSVPKEPEPEPGPPCQFNMYSLIISSTVTEKAAVQKAIQTFAGNITELQYSAALMLSCVDRDRFHTVEQELFRASFPRTSVVGCYNDAVMGYNNPDIDPQETRRTIRPSDDYGGQEFMHSNSTVFVYFTWGKQHNSGEEAHHSRQ